MKRLLVANRGEIAVRILSAARELDICAVAIYTQSDTSHISHADEAVQLPDAAAYLDVNHLVDICKRHKIDAVHPGYGFLSESPEFASSLEGSGITFIGPSAETLRITGNKLSARQLAEECGVPVLPALKEPTKSVSSVESFARKVGYPVMLKAVDGGGGRGIRLVMNKDELDQAFKRAQAESPSNQIFVEKAAVQGWRHVEVQIMGDGQSVRHFWERECSIQRRYQKIVEIAPSTLSSGSLRAKVIGAAMRIAKSIKYNSLGTFEFLVSPGQNEYYFMEINPRLQVEHTITETIASIDLVHLQLQLAEGRTIEELGLEMPGEDANPPKAVAIQLRVTAEDTRNSFALSIGRINQVSLPGGNGVRVDTHIEPGTIIAADFDSLLAKVIVYSHDYISTIGKGLRALGDLSLEGVTTNLDLLKGILLSEAFQNAECDTDWLEKNLSTTIETGGAYQRKQHQPAAAIRSKATAEAMKTSNQAISIKKGDAWDVTLTRRKDDPEGHNIRIAKIMRNDFPNSFAAEISISSATSSHSDPSFKIELTQASSNSTGEGAKARRQGDSSNPSHLVCPLSGTLVEMLVEEGDIVDNNEAVAIIRQMKMELEIRAHRRGTVSSLWDAEEGENVESGSLVCELSEESRPKEKL